MNRWVSTLILLLVTQIVNGQITSRKEANLLLHSLTNTTGILKKNSLLKLAEFNILKPGEFKNDLDSADNFINEAIALKPYDRGVNARSLLWKAYITQESGKNSKDALINAAAALQIAGDSIHLAIAYIQLSKHYSGTIPTQVKYKTELMDKALVLLVNTGTSQQKTYGLFELKAIYETTNFTDANWKVKFLNNLIPFEHQLHLPYDFWIRKEIMLWNLNNGNYVVAEDELNKIIREYKKKMPDMLPSIYLRLPPIYIRRGKDSKAIFYAFETIKSSKIGSYKEYQPKFYLILANIYLTQDKWDEAMYWTKAGLELMDSTKSEFKDTYFSIAQISSILILKGKAKESLRYVLQAGHKYKAVSNVDRKYKALALAQSYSALKQFSRAEPYFLEMEKISAVQIANNEIREDFMLNSKLGLYFANRKQNHKAEKYLKKALAELEGTPLPTNHTVRMIYLSLFKIDSAAGKYLSAIGNLQHSQFLNDSIVKIATIKQKEELQVAYETDKKKEEIRRLENNELIQVAKLQKAEDSRNWIIAGAAMLLLLLGFSYNRYYLKQRSLRHSKIQREEIALINTDLKSLLNQKDHLLAEKEWLLKEVHHRVKNNLHTVYCLLESQATYLENDALKAIENSQHRIYAMSLIHQKLYQTDDIKSIDMSIYIPELIQYLGDSFGTEGKVHFDLQVESVDLNITYAIPLGLIINEAVTNSIKYAFPSGKIGIITISMKDDGDEIRVLLSDNGIGIMSKAYESHNPSSLGLELMKGLCADIKAQINFNVTNGTSICIIFKRDSISDSDNFVSLTLETEIHEYTNINR